MFLRSLYQERLYAKVFSGHEVRTGGPDYFADQRGENVLLVMG
jgi:hypothetical protein